VAQARVPAATALLRSPASDGTGHALAEPVAEAAGFSPSHSQRLFDNRLGNTRIRQDMHLTCRSCMPRASTRRIHSIWRSWQRPSGLARNEQYSSPRTIRVREKVFGMARAASKAAHGQSGAPPAARIGCSTFLNPARLVQFTKTS